MTSMTTFAKYLRLLAVAWCCAAPLAHGQAWTPFLGFVPSGSKGIGQTAIDWSTNTGLYTSEGLPPDGSWTQSGGTLTPSGGDDTAAIQAALNACGTSGHFIRLGVGTFNLSGATPVNATTNNCVLRGTGTLPGSRTTINITSNIQDGTIRLGGGGDPNVANAVNVVGGVIHAGDTTLVVPSATNFHVGDLMLINELNDYSYVSTLPGSATTPTQSSILAICPGTGTINSGSSTFTCGSSVFTAQMVGTLIQIPGAGAAGGTFLACIGTQSGTSVTLKNFSGGSGPCTASVTANTTVTGNASLTYSGTPSEPGPGCTYCDGLWSGTRNRGQNVKITGVSGTSPSTITYAPPAYTEYTLTPLALPFTPTYQVGLEYVYITENGTHTNRNAPVGFNKCDGCWMKGVQIYFSDGDYAKVYWSYRSAVLFNYLDNGDNHGPGSDNQAILLAWGSSANWVVGNICVRCENTVLYYLGASGNVMGYGYGTGGYGQPTTIIVGYEGHSTHTQFNLLEGNIDAQNWYDVGHGTNSQHTSFRNWWIGTNLFCGGANTKATVNCTSPAWTYEYNVALRIDSLSFYINSIGDVVGSPAMEALGGSKFSVKAWPTSRNTGGTGDDKIELSYGYTLQSDTGANSFDSTTAQSQAFIHGLYSNHSGTTTWSGAITHTLPASFFLPGKPSWWGSLPYPGIGPDITGGTIPAAATAGPSPGGHVNENPAMHYYYASMGGKEGGDGSPYDSFDGTVYGTGAGLTGSVSVFPHASPSVSAIKSVIGGIIKVCRAIIP